MRSKIWAGLGAMVALSVGCADDGAGNTTGGFTTAPATTTPMTTGQGTSTGEPTSGTTDGGGGSGGVTEGMTSEAMTTEPVTTGVSVGSTGPGPMCGDGVVDDGEECDDGNQDDTDACLSTCVNAKCGDGVILTGVEACDDGNMVDDDACTNMCTSPSCGDGIVGPGEMCDDGNMVDTDDCTNLCAPASCGDMVVQDGVEECDDGNMTDTDGCLNACKTAKCGDGVVQAGVEECEDGNMVDTDACTNMCKNAKCGDGIVQAGVEQCDDGNMVDNDGCSNACKIGLRPNVLRCGSSGYDVKLFFPNGTNFNLIASCTPDNNTQAMFVTRSFGNAINANTLKTYLQNGGIVLTEFSISDEVYTLAFQAVAQGAPFTGSCQDRIPTTVQFNPGDPFWQANVYQSIPLNTTGCGYPVSAYPGLTLLSGWSAGAASIGYRDLGAGRLWVTEYDWQDNENYDKTYSRQLMGYMMTHAK